MPPPPFNLTEQATKMSHSHIIPLFPLGVVLFPEMPLPLHIFEERYKQMIRECLEHDRIFGVTLSENQQICSVGCTARIVGILKEYPDGRMDILIRGVERFTIDHLSEEKPYLQAHIQLLPTRGEAETGGSEALRSEAISFLKKMIQVSGQDVNLFEFEAMDSTQISFFIAAYGLFTNPEKQELLEIDDTQDRLKRELEMRSLVLRRLDFNARLSNASRNNGRLPKPK